METKKVQWKKDILQEIKSNPRYYNTKDPMELSVLIDHTWYSSAFDVPYFVVEDKNEDSWRIISPKIIKDSNWVIQKKHVEPYNEFPELDKAFEWD